MSRLFGECGRGLALTIISVLWGRPETGRTMTMHAGGPYPPSDDRIRVVVHEGGRFSVTLWGERNFREVDAVPFTQILSDSYFDAIVEVDGRLFVVNRAVAAELQRLKLAAGESVQQ